LVDPLRVVSFRPFLFDGAEGNPAEGVAGARVDDREVEVADE
jgi:hypothetical protein